MSKIDSYNILFHCITKCLSFTLSQLEEFVILFFLPLLPTPAFSSLRLGSPLLQTFLPSLLFQELSSIYSFHLGLCKRVSVKYMCLASGKWKQKDLFLFISKGKLLFSSYLVEDFLFHLWLLPLSLVPAIFTWLEKEPLIWICVKSHSMLTFRNLYIQNTAQIATQILQMWVKIKVKWTSFKLFTSIEILQMWRQWWLWKESGP